MAPDSQAQPTSEAVLRADVVFAGGGISAFIAAVELLAAGKQVVIVDSGSRENRGGQCRDAFGGLFFVDSPEQRRLGIKDSAELAWSDWQVYAEFDSNSAQQQSWAKLYIERCVPEVRDWMTGRGLKFFPAANWAERAYAGKGNSVPRFHLLWGCGPQLVANVWAELAPYEGRGLTFLSNTYVTDLVVENGACVGLLATSGGDYDLSPSLTSDSDQTRQVELRAEHVVISSGGRTGNMDNVRSSWPVDEWSEPPAELLQGVWPQMDGHLHELAQNAGAAVANLENMWVYAAGVEHWKPDFPGHGLAIIPPKSALWLQSSGRRFDPVLLAGYDTRDAVARIAAQDHPWSWMVMSKRILSREIAIQGARFNQGFRERDALRVASDLATGNTELAREFINRCPDVVTAQSVSALAEKMARLTPNVPIDVAGMTADIDAYDAQIGRGGRFYTDPQLVSLRNVRSFLSDKVRTAAFRPIVDPRGGELVAIRTRLTPRKTLGGIVTDEHCRVLDDDGAALPGLYAIGEAAGFGGGGMNGKRTLEGTLLGGCILTARRLARSLATS